MRREFMLTIGFYAVGLIAIGGGAWYALSPAWASVLVGSILLCTVFIARMGGRKE